MKDFSKNLSQYLFNLMSSHRILLESNKSFMAKWINFFLCYPTLVETFYLFEDLICFLLFSSRFINIFLVSQVPIISAVQPLTISKSQSLQKEWCPKADTPKQLYGSPTSEWKLVSACHTSSTPHWQISEWDECEPGSSVVTLAKLTSCERHWFCPVPEGQHYNQSPHHRSLSQSPTLPESACWLSQEDATYKDNNTLTYYPDS